MPAKSGWVESDSGPLIGSSGGQPEGNNKMELELGMFPRELHPVLAEIDEDGTG